MLRPRLLPSALVLTAVLVVSACSGDADEPAASDEVPTASSDEGSPPCPSVTELEPGEVDLATTDPVAASHAVAGAAIQCAETAVVVPADAPALAAVGVPLAAANQAPLLLDGDLDAIVGALGDPEIRDLADELARDTEADAEAEDTSDGSVDPSVTEVALRVAEELDTERLVLADAEQPADLAAAAALAIRDGGAVIPVVDGELPELGEWDAVAVGALADAEPDLATDDDPWAVEADTPLRWAMDPESPEAASVVAVAALRGDAVLPVPGGDLLARDTVERVRDGEVDAGHLVPVGALAADAERDVQLLAEAPLLPGGTLRHFDGTRMVALYGRPGTPSLGVLGEQELDETIERAREVGEGYDADGRDVIPTLEVIVSVATGDPQDDESYSNLTPAEEFRDLVDQAAEEDAQVILDLQPGRTDFLTQAREYEELLREPHVGLALDPEWRLTDDQVHLEQIGGVEAAEVQEVVDWYAELTRDAGLSEGLLVLHQFRLDMLRDRDTIEIPPEVAAVVHADGQGPQEMKMDTWRTLTAEGSDQWLWGWKNFYDEDPVVATPDEVLDLDPEVVLVTYQ